MNFNRHKNTKKIYDVDLSKKHIIFIKRLSRNKSKCLGRSYGKIVCWHKGGGVKKRYNLISNDINIETNYGLIRSINYDSNRSGFIATVQLKSGEFCYRLVSSKSKINDIIKLAVDKKMNFRFGDTCKLRHAPIGIPLYNLENRPGSGPIYSKAGGVSSILLSKDLYFGRVKLGSGQESLLDLNCQITIGSPSNSYNKFHKKYKAGTNRLLNKRPTVRGVAMNPVDHPHGGGEGKSASGRPSVSPWGKLTKGVPTVKKK